MFILSFTDLNRCLSVDYRSESGNLLLTGGPCKPGKPGLPGNPRSPLGMKKIISQNHNTTKTDKQILTEKSRFFVSL